MVATLALLIFRPTGQLSIGDVIASGGDSDGNDMAGAGGNVSFTATSITAGSIDAQGGAAGTTGNGNNGGNISLISTGNIALTGAANSSGSAGGGSGNNDGGDAGTIDIQASGQLSIGDVIANGGNSDGNDAAGDAGAITLMSTSGLLTASGNITANEGIANGSGSDGDSAVIDIDASSITFNGAAAQSITGTDITIDSTSNISLLQNLTIDSNDGVNSSINNVTLNADIDYNGIGAAGNLIIGAGNDVAINGNIIDSDETVIGDQLQVTLNSNNDGGANGDLSINGSIDTNGSDFTATGFNYDAQSEIGGGSKYIIDTGIGDATVNITGSAILGEMIVGGAFAVTAPGGISQGILNSDTDDLVVSGISTFTTNLSNDLLLENENDFSSITANGDNIRLVDVNGITVNTASSIGGDFSVIAGGNILQDAGGLLVTSGNTTLSSTGDIILSDAANDFGSLSVSASNATIQDVNNIAIGSSTISNTLNVTSIGGDILTDGGPGAGSINVGGLSTLTASGNDITLNDTNNNFSTVNVVANNIVLSDIDSIQIGASTIGGSFSITANNAITQTANALVVTGGSTTLTANDITLGNALNDFTTVILNSSNTTLEDANNIILGASNISGAFSLTALGGDITQSGDITGGAAAALTATSNIDLQSSNDFSSIAVSAIDVDITDVNNIALGNSTITGNLDLTALGTGNITQNGAATVSGVSTFTAAGDDITLLNAGNDFSTLILTANDASIRDANGVVFGASSITNDFSATTAGDITQSGVLVAGGVTTLDSGANNILLDAANNLDSLSIVSANDAFVDNSNINLSLNAINVSNNLSISAGDLMQSGDITSQNGDISLIADGLYSMSSGSTTVATSGNVNLQAVGDASLARLTALNGTLEINSTNGEIIDANGDSLNLRTERLNLFAADGIGSSNELEIRTNLLDAQNTTNGKISLDQTGSIELIALKNTGSDGDITFNSNGDINFNPDSTVASLSSGNGNLIMRTSTGSFLGLGTADINKPDITAKNATFIGLAGTFGSFDRNLTLNVPGDVVIQTRGSFDPQFVPPGPATVTSTGIDFSLVGTITAIAGEQLVEIESLSEVDPAIFTALRNYSQEEISIRMPRDQLYEDDLEGDEATQ